MTTTNTGSAGTRHVVGLVSKAVCGETRPASLDEEGAKVDLHLTFRHAFSPRQLVVVCCQVKAGESYARRSNEHVVLNIDRKTRFALSGVGTPGLIVWVPAPPHEEVYWYAADPRTRRKSTIRVSKDDLVRPTLRYDLTRLAIYATWVHKPPCQTVRSIQSVNILKYAKRGYLELKQLQLLHPLVGKLNVTRAAWRHVTRRSKTSKQRNNTLMITPYLRAFLDRVPDRYGCIIQSSIRLGTRIIETRHVTCWYRDALLVNSRVHTLVVRIKEVISYPEKWQSQPVSTDEITQKATLVSWWHTIQK